MKTDNCSQHFRDNLDMVRYKVNWTKNWIILDLFYQGELVNMLFYIKMYNKWWLDDDKVCYTI